MHDVRPEIYGKRPDGATIAPWKSGRPLVWDATCPDTYAASYVIQSTSEVRAVAKLAETKKRDKYLAIARSHHFVPVAVETSGAFGPEALELFDDIARRIRIVSQEVKSRAFLFQRISVALQQGNASAVLGTAPVDIYNEFVSLYYCIIVLLYHCITIYIYIIYIYILENATALGLAYPAARSYNTL